MTQSPKKLPSNTRIARQKKAQAGFSLVGGTLGLAALASRGKATQLTRAARKTTANGPKLLNQAAKWKDRSTAMTTTGAGVGGVGAYNFASYTNADAKKQQRLKKNLDDPFEIHKLGGPKFRGQALTFHESDDKTGERKTYHPTDMLVRPEGKSLILRRNKYEFTAYPNVKAKKGKSYTVQPSPRVKLAPRSVANEVETHIKSGSKKKKNIGGLNVSVGKADTTSAFGINHGY